MQFLRDAFGVSDDDNAPPSAQPRLNAVSFLRRFGSASNHHVHLRRPPRPTPRASSTSHPTNCSTAAEHAAHELLVSTKLVMEMPL